MSNKLVTKLHSYLPLLVSSFVFTNFVLNRFSHVRFVLGLLHLKCSVVIWAYFILVPPKHSDEWSITPILSLVFPALPDLFQDTSLNIFEMYWASLPELLNELVNALLLIVNGGLFKVIYDPLIIVWWNLNLVIDELFNFLLVDLVVLLFERPVLFCRVLYLIVYFVKVSDVVVWNNAFRVAME